MKVSAIGLFTQVASLLPKRSTTKNQASLYRHLLLEMVQNIEKVQKGEVTQQDFCECYCIVRKP